MRSSHFITPFGALISLSLLSMSGVAGQVTLNLDVADTPIGLELLPLFSVGSVGGREWEAFAGLSGVNFDGSGNLYILDAGNCRLVKLAPDGTFLTEIGRRGGGPGEFSLPLTFAVTREGLIHVYDVGTQNFTTFDSDGQFITTAPLAGRGMYTPNEGLIPLPDGRLITGGRGGLDLRTSPLPSDPSARRVDVLDVGAAVLRETLYESWDPVVRGSSEGDRAGSGHGMTTPLRAFSPVLDTGVLPDGSVAVVDSTNYEVKIIKPGQGVVREIVRPIPTIRVSRRDEERERERRLELLERGSLVDAGLSSAGWLGLSPSGGGHGMPPSGEVAARLRERIQTMEFGEEVPAITGIAVDWSGRIWVQRSGDRLGERGPIDILSGDGEYLGTVPPEEMELPDAFGPQGLVAWIGRGEFDVPVVTVNRLLFR
jgi:hypothetical protein